MRAVLAAVVPIVIGFPVAAYVETLELDPQTELKIEAVLFISMAAAAGFSVGLSQRKG